MLWMSFVISALQESVSRIREKIAKMRARLALFVPTIGVYGLEFGIQGPGIRSQGSGWTLDVGTVCLYECTSVGSGNEHQGLVSGFKASPRMSG